MKTITTRVQHDGGRPRLFRRCFSLQVLEGPDSGKLVTTSSAAATVGSATANDLCLGDPAVSRHHLRIESASLGFVITDLDSTNGTMIGAIRLRSIVVRDPVDLRLGETVVRFSPLAKEEEVELAPIDRFGEVLGASPPMREMFGLLQRVSARDVTVLLEGETGTGKELIAREIHRHSPRQNKPFVVIDCGAIPPSLIESELFGHVRGAFTNATVDRPGVFEEARGGVILLDEIGELELSMQPQLLRVLERGEVKRLGEARYRPVDVRVIAATNRDLQREVNRGAFRADLYYRLAVVHARVPPLRQRPGDVELLVSRMLPEIAARLAVGSTPTLGDETMQQMIAHRWPGNVRELRNFLERLVTLSRTVGIEPQLEVTTPLTQGAGFGLDDLEHLPFKEAKAQWTSRFDIEYLTRLLSRCEGNVAEAARQSGIDRVHLFRLIKKYGLRR